MRFLSTSRALWVSGVLAVGLLLGCGKAASGNPSGIRCSVSNCSGCCDANGACLKGTSPESCGAAGQSCGVCSTGQSCGRVDANSDFGGRCGGPASGGGSGGGGATGGGTAGSGGGGGGATDCSAANCGNGCCSTNGVCITNTTPSRCGVGGETCKSCMSGNSCVNGACMPCTGCINASGGCEGGLTDAQCGTAGGLCQPCGNGQTCQSGVCAGAGSCAATCAGCCDGNNCIERTQFSDAQCGQAMAGATCVGCPNGATCDTQGAGVCVGGGTGGGGGIPGLDAGFDVCTILHQRPCPSNKCCDPLKSIFAPTCVDDGLACGLTATSTCHGATQTCQ